MKELSKLKKVVSEKAKKGSISEEKANELIESIEEKINSKSVEK